MMYFSRHMRMRIVPDHRTGQFDVIPTYSSEYVSDGFHEFGCDTNSRPPTDGELLKSYPSDFIGCIGSWISNFTRYIWRRKYGRI